MGSMLKKMFGTVCAMCAVVLMCGMTVQAKEVTVQGTDIQAALDQADSSTETVTVIIPSGTYEVGDILKVRSNTTIQAAEGATIKLRADLAQAGHPILSVSGVQNVTIQGGVWVYTCSDSSRAPIVVEKDSKKITFDGVTIETSAGCRWGFLIYGGSKISVKNSILKNSGIFVEDTEELILDTNKIYNPIFNGIRTNRTQNGSIYKNEINNAYTYGLLATNDKSSVIEGNEISGSASSKQRIDDEHGEGLVVEECIGTRIVDNTISNTHCNEKDNGNGIIVSKSTGVLVDNNKVSNSGNHGIQVTNNSTSIIVQNNKISNSNNAGIALSRNAQANLIGNTITDTAVNGIACDGHDGRVTVTIEGGSISNTKCVGSATDAPIWTDSTTGTISGVIIQDTKYNGITITKNSDVEIKNCKIYQSAVTSTIGIAVYASNASLSGNVISGFSKCGIYANKDGANITGGNNTVTLPGAITFSDNAIEIGKSTGSMWNNKLFELSISNTSASGRNYNTDVEAGAIIDGKKYSMIVDNSGRFNVTYPSVDTSKVAVYVKSPDGNVIIVNAPNGTTLDGTPESTVDLEQIEAFVTRVYRNVLGREPDSKGFNDWVQALATGQQDGAGVVEGFFFSDELEKKNLSIEDYLELVYVTMMNRASDPGGKQNWVKVYNQGFSKRYILNGFVGSKEFGEICDEYGIVRGEVNMTEPRDQKQGVTEFVSRNYLKALRRTVIDIEGLNNWCYAIIYEGKAPGEIVKGFIDSDEFIEKNHSDEEFVEILYQTFFDRDPDPAGFADWMGRLSNGCSRLEVADGFIGAQEFHQLVAGFGL